MNQLTLWYEYNDLHDPRHDDVEEAGRVTVSVATEQFSGTGTFETSTHSVRSFGESLSTFPITPGKFLEATWGYAGRGSTVVIRAANPTGTLLVGVIIEAGPFSLFDERVHEGVQTSFVTDYVQVDVFRRSIANLMDRKVNKATLRGH